MDETLPLLPLALILPLDRLPILILFLEPSLSASISPSFFGAMFSLPRPHRLEPLIPHSGESSPLPRPADPAATAPALSCVGDVMDGVDAVRRSIPPRELPMIVSGLTNPPVEEDVADGLRVGVTKELERVSGAKPG